MQIFSIALLTTVAILSAAALPSTAKAQANSGLDSSHNHDGNAVKAPPHDDLLNVDLLKFQRDETARLTPADVTALNSKTITDLEKIDFGAPSPGRLQSLTENQIQNVIEAIDEMKVIQRSNYGDYDQPGVRIGYCFGRATFAHLALLKIGVDKNSIRKAWVVGPMSTGGTNWQFHVTTLVRGTDLRWYAVDNFFHGEVKGLSDWLAYFKGTNANGKLRLYVTDPRKFSVSLSTYSRLQMGLDVKPEKDWYRGFFQELMAWFRTGNLADVGLKRL